MFIPCEKLSNYCEAALAVCGVSPENARITSEALVNADMRGIHSHGVVRIIGYVDCLLSGGIRCDAVARMVSEGPSNARVDADQGLGIPASVYAAKIAQHKALETGMGIVNVFNSHHHGACGYYSQMLAQNGLMAFAMSTGDVIMAASGSTSRTIGNNPFSYAVPAGRYRTICYDVAMSTVAAGKISIAADENRPIPLGWLLSPDGTPTRDPTDYDRGGALVAFGGHKGYGLSVMVECFAGILSGAAMLSQIHAWNRNPERGGNVGHVIMAFDPEKLNPGFRFSKRVEEMIEELASAPKAPGVDRILYPGQLEHEREMLARKRGVELPPTALHALRETAQRTHLPFEIEKYSEVNPYDAL